MTIWRLRCGHSIFKGIDGTGQLVASKLIPCGRCDAGVALLIFAPGATDPGCFGDYARRMYKQVVQMDVPTYVIGPGPALGDGPMMARPADILKIWPEREAMQRLRPDEFNPLLDQLAQTHCADGGARQALDPMRASGELHYRGTRRHRSQLCQMKGLMLVSPSPPSPLRRWVASHAKVPGTAWGTGCMPSLSSSSSSSRVVLDVRCVLTTNRRCALSSCFCWRALSFSSFCKVARAFFAIVSLPFVFDLAIMHR
jgi:hypothetical protein